MASSNYISESISLVRNLKKTAKGDKMAAFMALGNVAKVAEKFSTVNNSWGQAAKGAVDTFAKMAETSAPASAANKVIEVAKLGDEIGMVKSAVQTVRSSSPIRKGIQEVLGWTAKFTAKYVMLNTVPEFIKNNKSLNSVAEKVCDFSKNTKGMSQLPALISGIGYSVATINAPKYARQFGGWICDKLGVKPFDPEENA